LVLHYLSLSLSLSRLLISNRAIEPSSEEIGERGGRKRGGRKTVLIKRIVQTYVLGHKTSYRHYRRQPIEKRKKEGIRRGRNKARKR